jgi:hypothetical protein
MTIRSIRISRVTRVIRNVRAIKDIKILASLGSQAMIIRAGILRLFGLVIGGCQPGDYGYRAERKALHCEAALGNLD